MRGEIPVLIYGSRIRQRNSVPFNAQFLPPAKFLGGFSLNKGSPELRHLHYGVEAWLYSSQRRSVEVTNQNTLK
jgi:hypothetical protein